MGHQEEGGVELGHTGDCLGVEVGDDVHLGDVVDVGAIPARNIHSADSGGWIESKDLVVEYGEVAPEVAINGPALSAEELPRLDVEHRDYVAVGTPQDEVEVTGGEGVSAIQRRSQELGQFPELLSESSLLEDEHGGPRCSLL